MGTGVYAVLGAYDNAEDAASAKAGLEETHEGIRFDLAVSDDTPVSIGEDECPEWDKLPERKREQMLFEYVDCLLGDDFVEYIFDVISLSGLKDYYEERRKAGDIEWEED